MVLVLDDERQRHHRAPTGGLANPRLLVRPSPLQGSRVRKQGGVVPRPIGPNPLNRLSKSSTAEGFSGPYQSCVEFEVEFSRDGHHTMNTKKTPKAGNLVIPRRSQCWRRSSFTGLEALKSDHVMNKEAIIHHTGKKTTAENTLAVPTTEESSERRLRNQLRRPLTL